MFLDQGKLDTATVTFFFFLSNMFFQLTEGIIIGHFNVYISSIPCHVLPCALLVQEVSWMLR